MDRKALLEQALADVARRFGVTVRQALGGRLNQHWLVERGAERLVLRCWAQPPAEIDYETRVLAHVAALGWPVAVVVDGPLEWQGEHWSLSPFLDGEPALQDRSPSQQRQLGRLLAELHGALATIDGMGQRGAWRRCEAILADQHLDAALEAGGWRWPDAVRMLHWHLDRARKRIAGIDLAVRPGMHIHGDFTPWNLRFIDGRLSGVLDFELAHWDHRIGDFALSWRGRYDDVVHGYAEVAPLEPLEWALITPVWWAGLIDSACRCIRNDACDDGWILSKLQQRSALMGPDAEPYSV